MGHHDHATPEILEEILQNTQGLNVEIIGRLVQQQHIRCLNQHSTQGQASAFATRELAKGAVLLGRRKQEALQQLRSGDLLTTEINSTGRLFDEINHLSLQPFPFHKGFGVLVEIAHMDRFAQSQAALGGIATPCDQIQDTGFSASIGTDDPHAILRTEAVGEILEKRSAFRTAVGGDTESFSFDDLLADATADTGHCKRGLDLGRFLLSHGLDSLQPCLLLGAARLGALAEPGQLPA